MAVKDTLSGRIGKVLPRMLKLEDRFPVELGLYRFILCTIGGKVMRCSRYGNGDRMHVIPGIYPEWPHRQRVGLAF